MSTMFQAQRRSLKARCENLLARSKLAPAFGLLATTIVIVIAFSSLNRNQVEEVRPMILSRGGHRELFPAN